MPGVRGESDDARVDDQAPAGPHRAQGVLGDEERAQHVDSQHLLKDGFGIFGDRRDRPEDAGVGERDIKPAEAADRRRHGSRHRVAVGGVGDGVPGALVAELVDRALERVAVEVDEEDRGAFGDERPCGREPDAARAAGDQRALACEPAHAETATSSSSGSSRAASVGRTSSSAASSSS